MRSFDLIYTEKGWREASCATCLAFEGEDGQYPTADDARLDKVQVLLRSNTRTAKCYAKKRTTQLNTKEATTTREIRKTKQPQKEQQRGSNIGCVLMELLSGRTEGVAFINR